MNIFLYIRLFSVIFFFKKAKTYFSRFFVLLFFAECDKIHTSTTLISAQILRR